MGGIHPWVVKEFWGSGRYTSLGCKGVLGKWEVYIHGLKRSFGEVGGIHTWVVKEFWKSGRYTSLGCKGVLGKWEVYILGL